MNKLLSHIIVVFLFSVLVSCNTYRYVPKDDFLYRGTKIEFDSSITKVQKNELAKELEILVRPKPNSATLGIPIGLSFYNMSSPPKGKGLNYLLHEKMGQAPVLLSEVNLKAIKARLFNKLNNEGYLNAGIDLKTIKKGKDASLLVEVYHAKQFLIDSIRFPVDSNAFSKDLAETAEKTLLKKGSPLTLDLAKSERERIDRALRNKGMFFFSPDFILIKADTAKSGLITALVVEQNNVPAETKLKFPIRKFTVYANYNSNKDSLLAASSAKQENGFIKIDPDQKFNAKLFEENLVLKEGKMYSLQDHERTLKRLINLNQFKFINMNFVPSGTMAKPSIDATLFLTPYQRRSLQMEFGAYTKSTNFIGSEIKAKLLNRNLFHGAESIELNVTAGFEKQFGKSDIVGRNNYTTSMFLDFYTPRLWLPFKVKRQRTNFIPKTRISLGAEYIQREELYTMRSIRLAFGYTWKTVDNLEHSFNPIVVNLVQPTDITPKFDSTLAQDEELKKSFEKQFIIGPEYTMRYNNQKAKNVFVHYYNTFIVDLSGNIASLFMKRSKDSTNTKTIAGVPFAQYVLVSNDLRTYTGRGTNLQWVNRLFLGYGYTYGNSSNMPIAKQFFAGGSNSIRAFRNGTLGPGTYYDTSRTTQATQAGDIKIEFNSELRWKPTKYIAFATFLDAGNVWLQHENVQKSGSAFSSSWYRELAIGAGIGLRFDASIMVIRFDIATPLKIPYLPDGQRWVANNIHLGDPTWRKDNLVFNIAIGYPF
ncbi:MAG: BamA/TamA family outer membrane protein [Bacteroidetes bacterium]|nr:BamA/TamA family outer membrane protein [Bacteroidota bacterium]